MTDWQLLPEVYKLKPKLAALGNSYLSENFLSSSGALSESKGNTANFRVLTGLISPPDFGYYNHGSVILDK
jgi:hypothetical protein